MKKVITTLIVLLVLAGGYFGYQYFNRVPPAVGIWDMSLNTPLGLFEPTLTLNADGSGSMSSVELGAAELEGAEFDGNSVSFDIEVDAQGQLVALRFTGEVDGDNINGQFGSDFGIFPASGTRQ